MRYLYAVLQIAAAVSTFAMPTRLAPLLDPPVASIETMPMEEKMTQQLAGCVSPVDELGPSRWALLDDSPDDKSSSGAAFDSKTPVPDDSVDAAMRFALSRRAAAMSALSGNTMPSGGAGAGAGGGAASPRIRRAGPPRTPRAGAARATRHGTFSAAAA